MKTKRINELNNLYAVPKGKVYKVKRNSLKRELKQIETDYNNNLNK